jgi:hypothetical protein
MRVTYLVLAHHKPDQHARLVAALTRGGSRVVTHVDAAADEAPFRTHAAPGVRFVGRRHNVKWGGFGGVAAELDLLRDARAHAPADYYVLLSGVDYPIRPEVELVSELTSGATFISTSATNPRLRKPKGRLERYFYATKDRDSRWGLFVNRRVLRRLPKRNVARGLGGWTPYGGSTWWALPDAVAAEILDFVRRERRFVRFFRHSKYPDEAFFQTIVGALGVTHLRRGLTYADWTRPEHGGTAPAVLTAADLPLLRDRPEFFARKFDLRRDPSVYDRIDAELLGVSS